MYLNKYFTKFYKGFLISNKILHSKNIMHLIRFEPNNSTIEKKICLDEHTNINYSFDIVVLFQLLIKHNQNTNIKFKLSIKDNHFYNKTYNISNNIFSDNNNLIHYIFPKYYNLHNIRKNILNNTKIKRKIRLENLY